VIQRLKNLWRLVGIVAVLFWAAIIRGEKIE
jgi:hypothetical protein